MDSHYKTTELCDSLSEEQRNDLLRELIKRKRDSNSIAVFGALFAVHLRDRGFQTLADRAHAIAELATDPTILAHNIDPKVDEPSAVNFRRAAAGTNDNRAAAWLMLAARALEEALTPIAS